jgi:hypothetical protein
MALQLKSPNKTAAKRQTLDSLNRALNPPEAMFMLDVGMDIFDLSPRPTHHAGNFATRRTNLFFSASSPRASVLFEPEAEPASCITGALRWL